MSGQRFMEGSREQVFLLPPDMREWLPPEHLVWVVIDAVAHCETSALAAEYRADGQGRPAYDPRVMATLLLYAYAVGERSSRQVERRCREDVAFRVAAAGLQPDHVTIARFRRRHAEALISLFGSVLGLCAAAGLVRVGLVAIDGTKVAADANKDRLAEPTPEQSARAMLAEAEAADAAEDALPAAEQSALRGLAIDAPSTVEERQALLAAAAQRLAQTRASGKQEPLAEDEHVGAERPRGARERGRELAQRRRGRRNRTDPDSRVMRTRTGWIQGYNAQVAVAESHVVVACAISQELADNRLLEPMVARTEEALAKAGARPRADCYLADGGYWNGRVVEDLAAGGRRLLVKPNGRPRTRGLPPSPPVARMERRLARPASRSRYRRRQALVEPVIAHIKVGRRLDRFRLRGLAGAELEWTLACTAHNLRRLHRSQHAAA